MDKDRLIQALIKATVHRAIRETVACLLVIVAFAYILHFTKAGSARYYGCLIILISSALIVGVNWAFTLSYNLLRTHPTSDSAFWHESRAIHAAYAGGAQVAVLPLEYYEEQRARKIIEFVEGQRSLESHSNETTASLAR